MKKLLFLFLLFCSSLSYAETYRLGANNVEYSSFSSMITAGNAYLESFYDNSNDNYTYTYNHSEGAYNAYTIWYDRYLNNDDINQVNQQGLDYVIVGNCDSGEIFRSWAGQCSVVCPDSSYAEDLSSCPSGKDCSTLTGTNTDITFTGSSISVCIDECTAILSGSYISGINKLAGRYIYDGTNCANPDPDDLSINNQGLPDDTPPPNNCITNPDGKILCAGDASLNCATYNGQTICLNGDGCMSTGTGTIICDDSKTTKNCGYFNGQYICAQSDTSSSPPDASISDGTDKVGVNDKPVTTTDTTTVDNGDGTKTQTSTTTTSIIGESDSVTTVTGSNISDAVGSTTSTSNSSGSSGTDGEGICTSGNCEDFEEILEESPSFITEQSELDNVIINSSVESDDFINSIGSNLTENTISTNLGTTLNSLTSSVTCTDIIITPISTFPGVTIHCSDLSTGRNVLSWIFYIFTAFYLFTLVTSSSKT